MKWPTLLIINGKPVYRQDISGGYGLPLLYFLIKLGVNKTCQFPDWQKLDK